MNALSQRYRVIAALIVPAVIAIVVFAWTWTPSDRMDSTSHVRPETSAQSSNEASSGGLHYVGSQRCSECHRNQHQTYLLTAHSRALTSVNPDQEPADAEFIHGPSARCYQVFRRDGRMYHQEQWNTELAADENETPYRRTAALRYLVGSGRHSRTYLIEHDGFLLESPVTWYASTKKWAMSPGYDQPFHQGFERQIDLGCLVCHAGQVNPVGDAYSHLQIAEESIGCERCHGPGSDHAARWAAVQRETPDGLTDQADTADHTIVNPRRLDRVRQEAVCAQCHLRGDATIIRTGHTVADFRPGQRLEQSRIDYVLTSGTGAMKVVGHVDQMHASRCWTESQTLTCATCHESHSSQIPTAASGAYRQTCLQCHTEQQCGETPERRQQTPVTDNCVECHMPQVSTDIPHIAFTHHRIGVHKASAASETTVDIATLRLAPFGNTSDIPADELQRCDALACFEYAVRTENPEHARYFRTQAQTQLATLRTAGNVDGDVLAALARMAWEDGQLESASVLAEQSLGHPALSVSARVNALFVLGDCQVQARRFDRAALTLRQLTKARAFSEDWLLLGLARFQSGFQKEGLDCVETALRIQPFRPEVHETLSRMYAAAGNQQESDRHARIAVQGRQKQPAGK